MDAFKSGAASLVEVVVAPGETLKLAQGALALKTDDSVKDALAALEALDGVVVALAGAAECVDTYAAGAGFSHVCLTIKPFAKSRACSLPPPPLLSSS